MEDEVILMQPGELSGEGGVLLKQVDLEDPKLIPTDMLPFPGLTETNNSPDVKTELPQILLGYLDEGQ